MCWCVDIVRVGVLVCVGVGVLILCAVWCVVIVCVGVLVCVGVYGCLCVCVCVCVCVCAEELQR